MLQQRKNFVAEFLLELECKSCSALLQFSSVQLLSRVRLFATPWIAAHQASLSITNSQSLLKLMSIESVILSNHLILCHPLLLLPPIPPSIRVFSILKLNCCYSRIRGSFPWTCPACPLPVSTVTEQLWIDVHTWSDGYHCYHGVMAITAIISVCLKDLPARSSWIWGQPSGRWSLKNARRVGGGGNVSQQWGLKLVWKLLSVS